MLTAALEFTDANAAPAVNAFEMVAGTNEYNQVKLGLPRTAAATTSQIVTSPIAEVGYYPLLAAVVLLFCLRSPPQPIPTTIPTTITIAHNN